jgi:hypothetical protein
VEPNTRHDNSQFILAVGLAVATLALVLFNALGNVALLTKVGPTPVLSLAAMVLATAAFVVSWKQRSYLVAALLAASGIISTVPALNARRHSIEVIVFPGSILGVIFGLVIFGLRVAMGIRTARAVTVAPR